MGSDRAGTDVRASSCVRFVNATEVAEERVLGRMHFPPEPPIRSHSTNPVERSNRERKRRANVIETFPRKPPSDGCRDPSQSSHSAGGSGAGRAFSTGNLVGHGKKRIRKLAAVAT